MDDESFRQWLSRHGAEQETVTSDAGGGAPCRAYCSGIEVGAGTLLYALLRLAFSVQGRRLCKMAAGMGETVFAPLYEVLARRGVRFEFFHRVDRPGALRRPHARRAGRVDRQARCATATYRPLVDVAGLPCWPSRPLYDQLVEGEALREAGHDLENWWGDWPGVERIALERGRDFDGVVLGISIGAFRDVCRELIDDPSNPRFRAMVENVRTTPTQSSQLWFGPAIDRLGWKGSSPMVIPYEAPMDTWADMSHLLPRESWPEQTRPGAVVYLTARLGATGNVGAGLAPTAGPLFALWLGDFPGWPLELQGFGRARIRRQWGSFAGISLGLGFGWALSRPRLRLLRTNGSAEDLQVGSPWSLGVDLAWAFGGTG